MAHKIHNFRGETKELHEITTITNAARVISNQACKINTIRFRNVGALTRDVYLKAWNDTAPTIGTDDPILIIPLDNAANEDYTMTFEDEDSTGKKTRGLRKIFTEALSLAVTMDTVAAVPSDGAGSAAGEAVAGSTCDVFIEIDADNDNP